MVTINNLSWGSITVDGQRYDQVLICGDQVEERDENKLEQIFGTTHRIGDWEMAKLISGHPQAIVIGHGQEGILRVTGDELAVLKKSGVDLHLLHTQEAVEKYNELKKQGVKVNALFHTTC